MRKFRILLATVLLMGTLAACSGENGNMEDVITIAPEEEQETVASGSGAPEREYAFLFQGKELLPGEPFDGTQLMEAEAVYEAPSCAIEGKDIVYQYGAFEITAMDDGTGPVLYSVYFLDPELKTPEGLCIGDSEETVVSLYGQAGTGQDGAWVYSGEQSELILILNNGTVSSIEYRMVS